MLCKGIFITAIVALLTSVAGAQPTSEAQQKSQVKAFSISQVPKHGNSLKKLGPVAYHNALVKYNIEVPSHIVNAAAAAAASQNAVPALPEVYDNEYLCPVNVGGTVLMLQFDTGSSDFWTFSNQLGPRESLGHTLYPTNGKLQPELSWFMMYGDNSGAAGNVYVDKVVIGGVTATSQAVEAATAVSAKFVKDTHSDGVVGLGFSNNNKVTPTSQKTFFDNVRDNLDQPLFAVQLKHNKPGAYDLGFIDHSKHSGSIVYTPVNSSTGVWLFDSSMGPTFADTGTSITLVPEAHASNYYSRVDGARFLEQDGGYVFPCKTQLPDFQIWIAGVSFDIPGASLNYQRTGRDHCFGGVQHNMGVAESILGDTFFKHFYVVFDGGAERIGFAPQV